MYVEIYRTKVTKEYRWRVKAANHKKIANGGEGYKNKTDLLSAMTMVLGLTYDPELDEYVREGSVVLVLDQS